jgi:selenocysteine-specific elongation factor
LANEVLRLEDQAGVIRAAAFRDRIQLGRKRSIQILEHFDRIGLTRRFGDERKIRRDSALAQSGGSSQLAGDTARQQGLGVPLAATESPHSGPG